MSIYQEGPELTTIRSEFLYLLYQIPEQASEWPSSPDFVTCVLRLEEGEDWQWERGSGVFLGSKQTRLLTKPCSFELVAGHLCLCMLTCKMRITLALATRNYWEDKIK